MTEVAFEFVAEIPCSATVDCVDFRLDGPGDHTIRPCRPEHLDRARAERAEFQAARSDSHGSKK